MFCTSVDVIEIMVPQLLSITELYLNDTFLEFLPANFGRLSRLRILELRENSLGTLPKSLSRLADLRRLDMGNNDLAEVPEVVGSLPELRELWLDGNRELQDRTIDLKHPTYSNEPSRHNYRMSLV